MEQFGRIMRDLRMEKQMSLRALAKASDISPAYLSDVERGMRNPPLADKLEKISEVLGLEGDKKKMFFDAAASDRREGIASDVALYAKDVQKVSIALRRAKDLNLSDEDWEKIIEFMEKKKG